MWARSAARSTPWAERACCCPGTTAPTWAPPPGGPPPGLWSICPAQVTNLAHALDSAEEAGLTIYGAGGAPGPNSLDAFADGMRLPAVLVLGNEDKGLRPGVAKRCAHMLRIPLARPFDSLNVAQAGAVLLGLAAAARSRGSVV